MWVFPKLLKLGNTQWDLHASTQTTLAALSCTLWGLPRVFQKGRVEVTLDNTAK